MHTITQHCIKVAHTDEAAAGFVMGMGGGGTVGPRTACAHTHVWQQTVTTTLHAASVATHQTCIDKW